jgi:hypothetical protein
MFCRLCLLRFCFHRSCAYSRLCLPVLPIRGIGRFGGQHLGTELLLCYWPPSNPRRFETWRHVCNLPATGNGCLTSSGKSQWLMIVNSTYDTIMGTSFLQTACMKVGEDLACCSCWVHSEFRSEGSSYIYQRFFALLVYCIDLKIFRWCITYLTEVVAYKSTIWQQEDLHISRR